MESSLYSEPEVVDVENEALPNFRTYSTTFDTTSGGKSAAEAERDALQDELVRNFITHFHKQFLDSSIGELISIYETSFNKLSERFFVESSWPSAEAVSPLVDGDKTFLIFYNEVAFRHIYSSKTGPSLQVRRESWENYLALFDYILTDPSQAIPHQWLWDMVDEFIYQFQTYCQFKARIPSRTAEEIAFVKENPEIWNAQAVIDCLENIIEKSCITEGSSRRSPSDYSLLEALGYFSMIGLSRVQCLLCDYRMCLRALASIDLKNKGLYTRVAACHISLYYYMGFSYLMLRRYLDAVKSFTNILMYLSRTKQYHTRSLHYDRILKSNDRIVHLLAVTIAIYPHRVPDEGVHHQVRELCGDKLARVQKGDFGALTEMLSFAAPKFVSPATPDYSEDPPKDHRLDMHNYQVSVLLDELKQHQLIPTIRSYLKLYSNITVTKLAMFMDVDETKLQELLISLKHGSQSAVWTGGPPESGHNVQFSNVEFSVEKGMIHVADTRVTRSYGDFFLRHIKKFDEIRAAVTPPKDAEPSEEDK